MIPARTIAPPRRHLVLTDEAARHPFRASLPPLVVNIHVYSPVESQRILYINNLPAQQGERIQAGVLVEEIVQDGIILRFRGQRFKIPRPS